MENEDGWDVANITQEFLFKVLMELD